MIARFLVVATALWLAFFGWVAWMSGGNPGALVVGFVVPACAWMLVGAAGWVFRGRRV